MFELLFLVNWFLNLSVFKFQSDWIKFILTSTLVLVTNIVGDMYF